MKKKFIGIIVYSMNMEKIINFIIVLMIITLSMGCIEQQSNDTNILDDIALTINDLDGTYELVDEEYITESYSSDDSKLFSGWNVTQKYRVLFIKNDTDFIQHEIVKLPSIEKTIEFQNRLNNTVDDLGYDFTYIDTEEIGNITLLFQAETQINTINSTIFLLTFNYQDLIVIIQTANIEKKIISEYANVVLNNIQKITENGF